MLPPIDTFLLVVNKDQWDTKEDTGRSMKNLYCMYCGMPKGTSRTSNSEKFKPVALAIIYIKFRLSEGISQSVSNSVTHSVSYLVSQ